MSTLRSYIYAAIAAMLLEDLRKNMFPFSSFPEIIVSPYWEPDPSLMRVYKIILSITKNDRLLKVGFYLSVEEVYNAIQVFRKKLVSYDHGTFRIVREAVAMLEGLSSDCTIAEHHTHIIAREEFSSDKAIKMDIKRIEALENKKVFYFPEYPCEKGHFTLWMTREGRCAACSKFISSRMRFSPRAIYAKRYGIDKITKIPVHPDDIWLIPFEEKTVYHKSDEINDKISDLLMELHHDRCNKKPPSFYDKLAK